MSHISRSLLVSLALCVAAISPALSADKSAKPNPATDAARQQVVDALRAEATGENDRRANLLTAALRTAPDLPEANWQQAQVQIDGKWLTLDAAAKHFDNDVQLAEYRQLRDAAADNPKLLRGLARWCLKNDLPEAAKLHYSQLLVRDDTDLEARKEAIQRLDLQFVNGTWISSDALKAEEEKYRAIEAALRRWRPRLKQLQQTIDTGDFSQRQKAIQELQNIADPQAIIALESFQMDGGDRFCEEAAKRLSQFPQLESTQALVRFAVLSPYLGTREVAKKALKDRPKHDYAPLLMSGLVTPLQSQFSISVDRNAVHFIRASGLETANARQVLVEKQTRFVAQVNPRLSVMSPIRNQWVRSQALQAELNNVLVAVQAAELQQVYAQAQTSAANRRVFEALEEATGEQLPREAAQWWNWWQSYNEYNWPKPTYCVYQNEVRSTPYAIASSSCFVAGTPVQTERGPAPIETIRPGDRVLAQDQDTGELAFKLVLRTTLRPSTRMVRLQAGGEQITTTLGHPFWVSGHGWKMAKELTTGERLHSLTGSVALVKIEPTEASQVHNLVVEDFNTYFVGNQKLLVHDNEFRKPTRATIPGLITEPIAAATR